MVDTSKILKIVITAVVLVAVTALVAGLSAAGILKPKPTQNSNQSQLIQENKF